MILSVDFLVMYVWKKQEILAISSKSFFSNVFEKSLYLLLKCPSTWKVRFSFWYLILLGNCKLALNNNDSFEKNSYFKWKVHFRFCCLIKTPLGMEGQAGFSSNKVFMGREKLNVNSLLGSALNIWHLFRS